MAAAPAFLLALPPFDAQSAPPRQDSFVKTTQHRVPSPLRTSLLAAALLLATGSSLAQVGRYDPEQVREHKQKTGAAEPAQAKSQFPNATRKSPELQATKAGGKALNEIVTLYQGKQYADAMQKAEALGTSSGNAYERSFAYQLAATAAGDAGDQARAMADYQKALDSNGLDNDQHFQVMYNLAVTQYQTKHSAEALATIDRLISETKTDAPDYLSLKASLLADLKRPEEAAAIYQQLLARDPNNAKALINAALLYQQGNQPDKANALLATARSKGMLKDASQYRALYVGYINGNKPKEAVEVIDEGLAKGILQPSPDLAQGFSVIAQNAYAAGDVPMAIAMYKRAANMATDGEASLNLARVLYNEGHMADAKKAAEQALQKGVKNTTEARRIASHKGS
jgi:tetratricopeptide (TPR) repeat protein